MLRFDSLGPQHHTINMIFDDWSMLRNLMVTWSGLHRLTARMGPISGGPGAIACLEPIALKRIAHLVLKFSVCMYGWMDGWIDVSMHLCINVSI